jgi:hypothetical protein
MVDTEKKIEYQSYYGYEDNHQRPCHCLGWLAIVHHHMDYRKSDDNP